jgi:signal transduction histidine kinase/DNA-binding NarL/FixJ family response regulator
MAGTLDGVDRIYSWRRVEPYGLIAIVGLSSTEALDGYRKDLRGCVAIGIGLTLLTLAVSAVLTGNRRDLIRSQAILRAAVDNISQGLMVVDAGRRVPILNGRAAELLGLPEHLTRPGFAFDSLLTWQVQQGEFEGAGAEPLRALVRAGGIVQGDSVYVRKRRNGTVLEIRTKALDSGLAVRTFTDITEQENNARVLAKARDAAEAAARARSEFLAVMSHEIRTPLNGVIGVAELLDGMELGPAQKQHVRLIRESGDHLLTLINDILDLSRLEASGIQLEETDFEPHALAGGVIAMFRAQAEAKGLRLTAEIGADVPGWLNGDPGRLRQVLLNLIGNAIKFTDCGRVALHLAMGNAVDGRVRLVFSIADTGIGIAPEAIETMFNAFTQADGSISRRFGGSGLGLAICRRLVERMGGTIRVDSEPGAGSTFRFDAVLRPGAEPRAAPAPSPEASDAPSLRILLAEDNPTNRLVAVRLLERLGHRADAVGNGAEAIAALRGSAYDLVLMDVMMPEMDGLAATREIRAGHAGDPGIPVVGLTAGSYANSVADCIDAGMNAVTTKPVTTARLKAAIAEGLAIADGRAALADHAPARLRDLVDALGAEAVRDIVRTFAEDTRCNLAAMRRAAEQGGTQQVYRIAHSVAGAARNVGADALAERAAATERNAGNLNCDQMLAEALALTADFEAVLADLGAADLT